MTSTQSQGVVVGVVCSSDTARSTSRLHAAAVRAIGYWGMREGIALLFGCAKRDDVLFTAFCAGAEDGRGDIPLSDADAVSDTRSLDEDPRTADLIRSCDALILVGEGETYVAIARRSGVPVVVLGEDVEEPREAVVRAIQLARGSFS